MCQKCADNRSAASNHDTEDVLANIMDRLDELERILESHNSDRTGYFTARPFHAPEDDDA